MKVLLFGATGMIGGALLRRFLREADVREVVSIGRNATAITDDKLHEIIKSNLFDYSDIDNLLQDVTVCFFCLGVSAAGMKETEYERLTHDLTVAAAEALLARSPDATFCYVSGVGTDSSERGRMMWARVKGRTENRLLAMPFPQAYMWRPGWIQPVDGARSRTRAYRLAYAAAGWTYPLLKRIFPDRLLTSRDLSDAMLQVARHGAERHVLEPEHINRLAAEYRSAQ